MDGNVFSQWRLVAMNRKARRLIIAILFWAVITPLFIEVALSLSDPWGVLRSFNDLALLYQNFQDDDFRGYIVSPGVHQYSNWSATVLPNGLRWTPNTRPGNCQIAFLGDSVTFGLGVSDGEVWVNLVAQKLSGVEVLNTGIPGYNIIDILTTRRTVDASVYVYLLIENDNQSEMLNWRSYQRLTGSAIAQYVYMQTMRVKAERIVSGDLHPAFGVLIPDPQVVTVVFDTNDPARRFETLGLSRDIMARYKVSVIPPYTTSISSVDPHPDAAGNREIAAAILPIVRSAVAKHCTAVL